MAASTPWLRPTSGTRTVLQRAVRLAAAVGLAPLVVLGALYSPAPSLLVGVAVAGVTGVLLRLLHRASIPDLPPLPHPAVAAVSAGLLPAAVAGTGTLDLLPFGILAGTVAPALAVGWWVGSAPELPPGATATAAVQDAERTPLQHLLPTLPVDVLFWEWRDVSGQAPFDGKDSGIRQLWRAMLVAELRRRDPDGTTRWLSEPPGVPPDGYVHDSEDGTRW
ncbi:hypothetical protein [Geodermatophilus sp. SYSU D00710]